MNANDNLELRLGEHFAAEAPPQAPDWVLADALSSIAGIQQRRPFLRVPWRIPAMPSSIKLAVGVGLLIAAAGLGLFALGGGPGPSPTLVPTPLPTTAAVTTAPSEPSRNPTPTPVLLPGYSSELFAYSLEIPTGWTVRPGSAPWPASQAIEADDAPYLDVFTGPDGYGPLLVTSQVLLLPDVNWRGEQIAYSSFWGEGAGCPDPPVVAQIEINGLPGDAVRPTGYIDTGCPAYGLRAIVTTEFRGYLFMVRGAAPEAWFRQLLRTVVLTG